MKNADFRVQTSAPSTPIAGVVNVYASGASGVLISQVSGGAQLLVGTVYTGGVAASLVRTGGAGTVQTGVIFSSVNTAGQTGLGTPYFWLPVSGPTGEKLVIPAYILA